MDKDILKMSCLEYCTDLDNMTIAEAVKLLEQLPAKEQRRCLGNIRLSYYEMLEKRHQERDFFKIIK